MTVLLTSVSTHIICIVCDEYGLLFPYENVSVCFLTKQQQMINVQTGEDFILNYNPCYTVNSFILLLHHLGKSQETKTATLIINIDTSLT
jgi:hypothetical protein